MLMVLRVAGVYDPPALPVPSVTSTWHPQLRPPVRVRGSFHYITCPEDSPLTYKPIPNAIRCLPSPRRRRLDYLTGHQLQRCGENRLYSYMGTHNSVFPPLRSELDVVESTSRASNVGARVHRCNALEREAPAVAHAHLERWEDAVWLEQPIRVE